MLVPKASGRILHGGRPSGFAIRVWLTAWLSLAAGAVGAATMPAVTMKVVDEGDGTPVPGVVALFRGTARQGTLTGHGGEQALLFAVEAVSDGSGELRFPEQNFSSQPFFLNTNYENPSMLLLKPGYAPLVLTNQLRILPTLAEASVWEFHGKTIRMKRATESDLRRYADLTTLITDSVVKFDRACLWKRAPLTLVAADRMFPRAGQASSLRTLLMNEALLVQQGCGSPKAFLDRYLRP